MDGGDAAYYWIVSVLILGIFLIVEEFKKK